MLIECATEVRRLAHVIAAGSVKTFLHSSHTLGLQNVVLFCEQQAQTPF